MLQFGDIYHRKGYIINIIQEVPAGDGMAEKEAQEKELEELEEGSSDEGDEEVTLSGIKKRSTGSGGTNPREDKSRPRGHRRKRYILKAEEKRWTKGILPYVYDSILGEQIEWSGIGFTSMAGKGWGWVGEWGVGSLLFELCWKFVDF